MNNQNKNGLIVLVFTIMLVTIVSLFCINNAKNENSHVVSTELKDSITYVNYIQKIQKERIKELVTIINYEVPAEKLVKLNLQLKRRERQIDSLIKLQHNLIYHKK